MSRGLIARHPVVERDITMFRMCPLRTACTEINTFITSGKGFSGPTEQQGRISFGMCPRSLISTPIIYTHESRRACKYNRLLRRDARACASASQPFSSSSRAACPLVDRAQPTGSFLCNRLEMDLSPTLFQVSKQDRDGEERVMSLGMLLHLPTIGASIQMQKDRKGLP